MKITVYRIEHAESTGGMYVGGRGLYDIAGSAGDDIYNNPRHPLPNEDSVLMASGIPRNAWGIKDLQRLHFGFASVEQLRNWLYKDQWLVGLHDAGYVLAIIETEEAYIGSTQAVFLRPDVYEKVSIKDYFKL